MAKVMWFLSNRKGISFKKIPVLSYHRVMPNDFEKNVLVFAITPEQFKSQLAFLVDHGFQSLSLEEFREIMSGLHPPPPRGVLITFDDGYADNYSVAWPIAQYFGVKLTLFIPPWFIGRPGPLLMGQGTPAISNHIKLYPELWRSLTWHEIRSMNESGVSIAIHGHTHQNMAKLSDIDFAREIDIAIEISREKLGHRPYAFAIPFGHPGTFNAQILKSLNRLGIELIFSTLTGRISLPCKKNPLSRLVIHKNDDLRSFEMKLFGAYDWIEPIRRIQQSYLEVFNYF